MQLYIFSDPDKSTGFKNDSIYDIGSIIKKV